MLLTWMERSLAVWQRISANCLFSSERWPFDEVFPVGTVIHFWDGSLRTLPVVSGASSRLFSRTGAVSAPDSVSRFDSRF